MNKKYSRYFLVVALCFVGYLFGSIQIWKTSSQNELDFHYQETISHKKWNSRVKHSISNETMMISCNDKNLEPRVEHRSGNFWVFYNYIQAERKFQCNETITYTTHGDYTYLEDIEIILQRWQGPISVALFTPGYDYQMAVEMVFYFRQCRGSNLIKDFATFHFYFPYDHMPNSTILTQMDLSGYQANCASPYVGEKEILTYRKINFLDYPINVGRNIARQEANSYFVFPSDIELYPTPGFIPSFLDMVQQNPEYLNSDNKMVFVLPIFEIEKNHPLPQNKSHMVSLLHKNIVVLFEQTICARCFEIPKYEEWLLHQTEDPNVMKVFHSAKRTGYHSHWEPFFISTHKEPYFDERLIWEGKSDKMSQAYNLCIMDYDFMILDNAFLIHHPGLKTYENNAKLNKNRQIYEKKARTKKIVSELDQIYGAREGCSMWD